MSQRDKLQAIVDRDDPAEWLNMLQHEATRANNAESAIRDYRDTLSRCQTELQYVRDGMVGHISDEGLSRLDAILNELRKTYGIA